MSIAVFDIDNTLVKGSTAFPALVALAREGLIKRDGISSAIYQQLRFRLTATEPDLGELRTKALAAIRDVSIAKIDEVLEDVADRLVAKSMFPGSVRLLREHLERGDEVWLATAGPGRLACKIAERLGAHGAVGSEVEVRDGLCTGALLGPFLHGKAKAAAIGDLIRSRGWDPATLHAYSDSFRDLPLLRLAGAPGVVNPDSRLRRLAEQSGWPVFDTSPRHRLTSVPVLTAVAAGAIASVAAMARRR